jgi:acyl-CoA hydrolase
MLLLLSEGSVQGLEELPESLRATVVTASSEQCDFHVPIRQGQLIELVARIVGTGNTSIRVEVDMYAEDLLSGASWGAAGGSSSLRWMSTASREAFHVFASETLRRPRSNTRR